ncbi:hypothetical protein MMC11_006264 [Xylographa trunciseda]|nr:hypothetical protein [Xylographa trunciseda]
MLLPNAPSSFSLHTWLVLIALVEDVFGQGNFFIYPPTVGTPIADSLVFELGSTVNLSWSTAYPAASLFLWQDTIAESEILLNSVNTSTFGTQYTWTVATILNLSASNVFHLCLYDLGPGATSLVNFNTVDFGISQSGSQLNDSSPNSTLGPSTQPTSITTSSPAASTNSSSAAASPAATSLPLSAVIGLGVGLGLGLPLLLAAGIFIGWRPRAHATRTTSLTWSSWGGSTIRHPLPDYPPQQTMQEPYSPVDVHPSRLKQPNASLYAGLSELGSPL